MRARLDRAIAEVRAAGWADDIELTAFAGPSSYLYGEETGLLEVLDGREPFPRVAPPWRHGIDEIGDGTESAADLELAEPGGAGIAPPTLANNVETMANVAGILAEGADWFRAARHRGLAGHGGVHRERRDACGTPSPRSRSGTPLREVLERDRWRRRARARDRRGHQRRGRIRSCRRARSTRRVTYEAMRDAGSGLGAAGFVFLDDRDDLAAVAQGIARFLAVESCGQCTPCKRDGLALAGLLDKIRRSDARPVDLDAVADRVATVADSARCALARQQQDVIGSVLETFPARPARSRRPPHTRGADPYLVAPIIEIADGRGGARRRPRHEAARLDLRRDRLRASGRRSASTNGVRNPTRTDAPKR